MDLALAAPGTLADPDFTDGSYISILPENLSFDHKIRGVGNCSWQVSFSATDLDNNPIVSAHDLFGPWRTYWRLRYGSTAIIAGPITSWNTKRGSDFMSVVGKTWEAYFDRWEYPFDGRDDPYPGHINDYQHLNTYVGDELVGSGAPTPTGLAYQANNRDVLRILSDILSEIQNVPNRMTFDISALTALSGVKTNWQLSLGDSTKFMQIINEFSDLSNGFDWWISHDRKLYIAVPYRFGDPSAPTIWLTVDDTLPGIDDLDFENSGPVATHVRGSGAGLATGTTLSRSYGYAPAQDEFSRLDESYDFGDIRSYNQLIKRTQKQLSHDLQPQHSIPISLNPNEIADYWASCRIGRAIYVDIELIAHRIDSAQRIISFSCSPDNNGNASVALTLEQIYDLSYNAGSPEG